MNKKENRLRRARKSRAKMNELKVHRLSIHRTSQHIYAQIIAPGSTIVTSASTLEKSIVDGLEGKTGNINAAAAVGKAVAEKSIAAGVKEVAFDRSGFKYHGRIKALAEAARESGLKF